LEPEVLRPLRLMTIYFFYMNLLSGLPLLPYLVPILNTFAAPVNVEWTIVGYLQTILWCFSYSYFILILLEKII